MIIITSIDALPDHCHECPCHDGESGYCQADKERRYSDYRPYWCPLKEIHDGQERKQMGMNDVGRILDSLKPCPFCGGKAGRRFHIDMTYVYDECIIECMQCGARIETKGLLFPPEPEGTDGKQRLCEMEKKAIEKWNRRV